MHVASPLSDLLLQQHFAAQLLGAVVSRLFPQVVLVGGGINSLGFYYDFILEQPLTESMLEFIEVHLYRFIKEGHPVRFISMMRENAQNLFQHHHHFLLAERAGKENSNILELVQIQDFYGLCPLLPLVSTQEVGHIKILEQKEFEQEIQDEIFPITRLIGTVQKSARDLKSFVKSYEALLKKRDHRLWGPKLDLFSFSESMGSLGVVWHPKGMRLRRFLEDLLDQQLPENVKKISTPWVVRQDFLGSEAEAFEPFLFEGEEYRLRSSLLRQHLDFLRKFSQDFEELPWRVSEYATLYRHYPESEWWGLFCQCAYVSDQTTIYCSKEQVISELISSLHFIEQIITIFGFEAQWYLIASRQKSPKARQEQEALGWLRQAIQAHSHSYPLFPDLQEKEDEEGPSLELRIRDVLGREWAASRVGVVPAQQMQEHSAGVVLTRQVWGSLDRFIALLIEHHEGVLPFWLAPEQVRVIAIGEANRPYARQISQTLQQQGWRVALDLGQAKLSMRVHDAEKENIPYVVFIGEQERIKQKISVRDPVRSHQNQSVDLETFLKKLHQESLCPLPSKGQETQC